MAQSMHERNINWQAIGEETVTRVRDLLRLDTRNPPGNERRAAEYLHALFEAEGIPGQIVGPSEDRSTFIARLKGDGSVPHHENAILKLAIILSKFTPHLLPVHFTTTVRDYIAGIAATQPPMQPLIVCPWKRPSSCACTPCSATP